MRPSSQRFHPLTQTPATAIVTGAQSGLGLASANRLSDAGFHVACCDVNPPNSEVSLPANSHYFRVDVTDTDTITALLSALTGWPPITVLINCAGILAGAPVVDKAGEPMPLADFSQVLGVNCVGTFNMLRLVAATISRTHTTSAMASKQTMADAVIINTASIAAFEGQAGQAAYSAAKGGVVSMTLPLARELKRYGIRVVCIAPGIMQTPMYDALGERVKASCERQYQYPARAGQPDEFAGLVLHIIENTYLNGCVIRLDGATRLGE